MVWPIMNGIGANLRLGTQLSQQTTFQGNIATGREETIMLIGNRLKELRESKQLSQGDVEKRTGLLRCYISRVENGHTVPAVETLEKMARALEVPMYRLFYDGEVPTGLSKMPKRKSSDEDAWDSFGKDARFLNKLRR